MNRLHWKLVRLISLRRARKGQLYLSGIVQCTERFELGTFFTESFWLGCSTQQIRGAPRRPSNEIFHLNYPELLILLTTKKMTYSFCVY